MTKEQGIVGGHIVLYLSLAMASGIWEYVGVTVASGVLAALLIWISVHDFRTLEIPDLANILLVASGLAFTGLWSTGDLGAHLIAAVFWGGTFWAVAVGYRWIKGFDGLGLGDAKMMVGVGAWLGVLPVISVVFVAAISGILYILAIGLFDRQKIRNSAIAFGPFLCLSTWYVWLFGSVGIIL